MENRYFITLVLLFLVFGCGQSKKDKNNILKENEQNMSIVDPEKQITYAIHINAKTPYELFIDDIPLERFYESGMNSTTELNQYLLKNGMHILKVRYLPRTDAADGLLQPDHVFQSKDAKWNIFFVKYLKDEDAPLGYKGEIDYQNSELEVVPPPKAVPFWEQKFELEVTDLPYKIRGWSESQDLSDIDEEVLKNDVFSFYEKIRLAMHEGRTDDYFVLNKKKYEEMAICTYMEDTNSFTSTKAKEELVQDCKNNMWPLQKEDYELKIYANGKLVALERKLKFRNQGLIAETDTDYWYYSFLLHKPEGTKEFEIIRK